MALLSRLFICDLLFEEHGIFQQLLSILKVIGTPLHAAH